ncbi:hypothetical protein ACJX0J_016254 [Zea mays]
MQSEHASLHFIYMYLYYINFFLLGKNGLLFNLKFICAPYLTWCSDVYNIFCLNSKFWTEVFVIHVIFQFFGAILGGDEEGHWLGATQNWETLKMELKAISKE